MHVVFANTFQFHPVRLKLLRAVAITCATSISIPPGPIEAHHCDAAVPGVAVFQFHPVRLKPTADEARRHQELHFNSTRSD